MNFEEWMASGEPLNECDIAIDDFENCWTAATTAERERSAAACDRIAAGYAEIMPGGIASMMKMWRENVPALSGREPTMSEM